MPKVRLLAAGAVLLVAAGCSSGSSAPAPPPSAVPTQPPAAPAPADPSDGCPRGAYRVTALEGRGEASAIGKGSGGNVGADFEDGTFAISSDGSQPVKLDLGSTNAQMRFNGEIKGTYEGPPSALRLTATDARGDVTVKGFGFSRTRSAASLADQLIGRDVTAQVTCDDAAGTAQVTLPNVSLTLARR